MISGPFVKPLSTGFMPVPDLQPVTGGATTLIYDTFTDTDTTALSSHTPDTNTPGHAWVDNSTWTISGNKAVNSDYLFRACIDTDVVDYTVSAVVNLVNTSSANVRGIVARKVDATAGGTTTISAGLLYSGGTFALYQGTVLVDSTPVAISAATDYTIQVVCSGANITATLDGGNELTYGSAPTTGTLQFVGLRSRYAGDTFDNFTVTVP